MNGEDRVYFCSLYWVWSLQSGPHDELLPCSVEVIVGGNETPRQNGQPHRFIIFVSIRQGCGVRAPEGEGGGINQGVSILLSMAARASEMIVLINNGPNNTACRRTRKDTGQKDSGGLDNNIGWNGVCLQMRGLTDNTLGKARLCFKNPTMHKSLGNRANYKMTQITAYWSI